METHEGAFFENMLADHPFLPKTSRLVLADYVTMDSGTGCVHTAPGFGADDYQTCKRYGMDMVVPVDDQGRHTDYAGKYAGMVVEDTKKNFRDMCSFYHVPYYEYGTKEELGHAMGKEMRASLAVTDAGFAKTLNRYLETEMKETEGNEWQK